MRVLLYSDGSPESESAARFTAMLTRNAPPSVTVLGVAEDPASNDRLLRTLAGTQKTLQDQGINTDLVLKQGEVVPGIVQHARETPFDLVVTGIARKGFAGPWTASRTAYKIIRRVTPPVLVAVGSPSTCSRILLCSSGRDDFENAVKFTAELARAAGASVLLLHIFVEAPAIYADLQKEDQDWLLHSGTALARNLRSQKELLIREGVACEFRLAHGYVTDEILNEIQTGRHDLLVVGSNPSGNPIESYILGDVTRELISAVQVPVLVVRATAGFQARFRRFLSAFGLSYS